MILITGAAGLLGKQIINFLLKKGLPPAEITGIVRNYAKGETLKSLGIHVITVNYNDYNSLLDSFKGIDKLLFISGNEIPDLDEQHKNIVNAASEAGVKYIVYTSIDRRSDKESTPIDFLIKPHIDTENEIIKSGIDYTFLRNCHYAENIPGFIGKNVFEEGIFLPAEDGKVPFASRTDLAEAAANVLLKGGHENKFYRLVNEVNYSFGDIAKYLSEISGKKVEYRSPACNVYFETLKQAGIPQKEICNTLGWISTIKQGYFEADYTDLPKLLGRKPKSLKEILEQLYSTNLQRHTQAS